MLLYILLIYFVEFVSFSFSTSRWILYFMVISLCTVRQGVGWRRRVYPSFLRFPLLGISFSQLFVMYLFPNCMQIVTGAITVIFALDVAAPDSAVMVTHGVLSRDRPRFDPL